MDTQNFKSTEAIKERLDILEESEVVTEADIDIWYKEFQGSDSEIITEVEIQKLGVRYVNTFAGDELSDLQDAYDSERSAELSYWYA